MSKNHKKSTSKVESAVPCGNPKRYGSRDVVHMPAFGSWNGKRRLGDDAAATQSEKHLKTLVNLQVKTDITITEQFSQHRSFSLATSHDPGVEKLAGVHNYKKFRAVNELDGRIDFLRHCGLNDEEITLKLADDMKDEIPVAREGYGIDPQSKLQKLREIERKVVDKQESLKVPDTFKGALELSRQALELEKSQSLKHGKDSSLTDVITIQKKFETTHPDDPVNHIHEMLFDIEGKGVREPRRERRKRRKLERRHLYYAAFDNVSDDTSGNTVEDDVDGSLSDQKGDELYPSCINMEKNIAFSERILSNDSVSLVSKAEVKTNNSEAFVKPVISQNHVDPATRCSEQMKAVDSSGEESREQCVETQAYVSIEISKSGRTINKPVQLICEDEITRNRLSLEEIRAMDKFQNYTEGEPINIVYVKNLPIKTTEEDLVALFGSFQSEGKPKIVFKLLTGRMKGQAFLTFPDEQTASRALKVVNGYIFKGRPMILSFGKQQHKQQR